MGKKTPKRPNGDQDLAKRSLKSFPQAIKASIRTTPKILLNLPLHRMERHFNFPVAALDSIETILKNLAEGKTSEIISETQYLTTQQAADYLDVSRPFVVRLLESGKYTL